MALHFPEKFINNLAESFKAKFVTESMMSHDLDQQFSGVNTVHEMYIQSQPLEKYDRTQSPATGSRYGTVKEVQDHVVTYTMADEISFTSTIDKGNKKDQLNMKSAGTFFAVQRDERIVPYVDTYRLQKWAEQGGIHSELAAELTEDNIVKNILNIHNEMLEKNVPEDGLTLVVSRRYLPTLKLAREWVALDSLGGKTLPSGAIGEFDNMALKVVNSNKMPENVAFMILHKNSILAPVKINDMKAHIDPPGLNGDLVEFRMYHDAFVRARKADGVAVAVNPGFVVKKPTTSISSGNVTVTTATSGATIYYTTDGSDPKFCKDRKVYSAAVPLAVGETIKAYAEKDGMYASDVVEYTRK